MNGRDRRINKTKVKKPVRALVGPADAFSDDIKLLVDQLAAAAQLLDQGGRRDLLENVRKKLLPPKKVGPKRRLKTVRDYEKDQMFNVAVNELIREPKSKKSDVIRKLRADSTLPNISPEGLKSRLNNLWSDVQSHVKISTAMREAFFQIEQADAAGFSSDDDEPIGHFLSRWAEFRAENGF